MIAAISSASSHVAAQNTPGAEPEQPVNVQPESTAALEPSSTPGPIAEDAPPPSAAAKPATTAFTDTATTEAPSTSFFGGMPDVSDAALNIKAYGDSQFSLRNHDPVHANFAAAHLDLFVTADVGRLSFLSEVFFEASDNEIGVDLERLQINYLVDNWLRLRVGRMHTAFGYYNDTYHHGNLFELSSGRPFAIQFEDEGGLFTAHLVGLGADGTFALGDGGSFRYDLEVGNGRLGDITKVGVEEAAKDDKLVNLRLRYSPMDGLMFGVNVQHDTVPAFSTATLQRPRASELVFAAHIAYLVENAHVLIEGYLINHDPKGDKSTSTLGGFAELGYTFGDFTPYVRPELIHFPKNGDVVYQAADSPYAGTRDFFDLRLGVRYQPMLQLAIKLELERVARDGNHQEIATVKVAFGF